jgi:RNA polymerase sigma-70 factor (ECF subfamily)
MKSASPIPDSAPPAGSAQWIVEAAQLHEAALRGYLHHRFPSLDADDVVQESYLKILRGRSGVPVTSAKAYFFSVLKHTALRVFRRRQKLFVEVPLNALPESRLLDAGPDAAEITDSNLRMELIADAVDHLPARCREIVRLAITDGLPAVEIAHRLGLSHNTVRVQLARGVRKCAKYIRERGHIL